MDLLVWVVGIVFTIISLEMRVDLVDAMLSNHTSRVGDDAGASQAESVELHSHTSYWHQFTLTFVLGIDTKAVSGSASPLTNNIWALHIMIEKTIL